MFYASRILLPAIKGLLLKLAFRIIQPPVGRHTCIDAKALQARLNAAIKIFKKF
jgi:hypothetical protein